MLRGFREQPPKLGVARSNRARVTIWCFKEDHRIRFPSTLLDFQSQFPVTIIVGRTYEGLVGRVGSCARAAEAGEATF